MACLTASSLNSGVNLYALMDYLPGSKDRPGMPTWLGAVHWLSSPIQATCQVGALKGFHEAGIGDSGNYLSIV